MTTQRRFQLNRPASLKTGNAGPTGGSPEKPVGTVYIALVTTFKQLAAQAAYNLLRKKLIGT